MISKPYVTPTEFTDLYNTFTGNPKSIGAAFAKSSTEVQKGVLLLFLNSEVYAYSSDRKLLAHIKVRTAPNSGFSEMTAVSHIGPALSYLLILKNRGDESWRTFAAELLDNINSVRAVNEKKENNWLDELKQPAWKGRSQSIKNMVDYACSLAENYVYGILNGAPFTAKTLEKEFLSSSSKAYPIPYNNVMIGTFMLDGMIGAKKLHDTLESLNTDWATTMVVLRNTAGANITAALCSGSNWFYNFLVVASNKKLPKNRIVMPAYAEVKASVGKEVLPETDYRYYVEKVWGGPYNRILAAKIAFPNIKTIESMERPALPGDYSYTDADNIMDFIMRLKYSFGNPTEMLSSTVGFWLPGELQKYNWDFSKIEVPGLTAGFPKGITEYPAENPTFEEITKKG